MIKHLRPVVGFLALLAAGAFAPAFAALTDLATAPLASTTSAQVKPNVMLLMDTSGSMGWGHMPDEVETVTGIGSVGYKSAQCNVLYFNPATTYLLPKKYDGTLFPAPSFTAAPYAGFAGFYANADATDRSITNLATGYQAYDRKTLRTATNTTRADGGDGDTPQAAYYYVYTGSQTLSYKTAPCTDTDTGVSKAATGGGQWTRVDVSTLPAANQANFAVWYSFYRTRISLIKSAASLAFTPLTDTFRVGFITVFPKTNAADTSINTDNYLKIGDFNAQQRNDWFSKLFSQSPRGSSPAREGLARVGRMYAGKHDGINSGMQDDPVQYSCQQNFAIMTTDGYWNTQDESPNGGPVKIDGSSFVGQQDGTLVPITVDPNSLTPRPIWDGTVDGTAIVENYTDAYSYAACGSYAYRSTLQYLQSTSQNLQSTTQTTQSTLQNLQSTSQNLQSTSQNVQSTNQTRVATSQALQSTTQKLQSTTQNLQSTTQTRRSTLQILQSTTQKLQSTNQNLQSTSQSTATASQVTQTLTVMRQSTVQNLQSTTQNVQSTSQPTASTSQLLQSTTQNLRSITQNLQSTSQIQQSTVQALRSTNQPLQSTSQVLQSTSQATVSTSQIIASTQQINQSTSQITITTVQLQRATSQTQSCDAHTESCTYVAPGTCNSSRYISCSTTTSGPTLVASCTPQTAAASNNYLQVNCTSNGTGPTGTGSCTAANPTAANSYTRTTCNTVTTGPTAVASCTPQTASAGNSYTTTSCGTSTTGPTAVASCTPQTASASNNYTQTTCSTATTGPTAAASCSPSGPTAGNGYTTTTCSSNVTTNVPVASCTPATGSAGNGYTTTTCTPVTTGPTAVASCSPQSASAVNNYTATTCSAATSGPTPVASCTPVAGSSGNNYTQTTCSSANSGPTGVASCSPATASSANNYVATSCNTVNTGPTGVPSCTASGPTSGNAYTTTTCSSNNSTNVPVASCAASGPTAANFYTTTTCPAPVVTTNVPSASCTPAAASSANNYVATTCTTATSGPTVVASCTASSASSSNNYTATTCASNTTTNVPVNSCSASGPSSSNNYTTTTCNTNTTTNVPVASCTPASASSSNNFTTTTCSNNNTSNVAVASCTAAAASAGNNWTTTSCSPSVTGPTVVASCTPVSPTAGNGYTQTTCGNIVNTTGSGNCVASGPTAGNNYTTTSCGTSTTTNVPVASCTPSGPSAGNNWVTTTCPAPVTTTNVPVANCTAATASAGNSWTTTTCPTPVTTTNVPVASCTAATASAGNSWTTTTCPTPVTSGPTGVASCTPDPASSSNSYVQTTCAPNNTTSVPVASCTPSGPTPANGYTTTTCPTPVTTSNVPVASCTAATAAAGNSWTTTTCPTPVTTTNVPVATCTASPASSGNNYVATTCPSPIVTGPTPASSCTPASPTAANNYVATTCPSLVTTNVPVQSCTASGPTAANNWTTTTCPSPITTSNVAVASCTASGPTAANNWTTTTCPPPATTTNVAVASCTAATASSGNGYTTTTCSSAATGPTGVASCTPVSPTAANNYTTTTCAPNNTSNVPVASCAGSGPSAANGYTTTSCTAANTSSVPVGSCTAAAPSAANNFTTTTCSSSTTGPTLVTASSCVAAPAGGSNAYTATSCAGVQGKQLQYTQTHTVSRQSFSGGLPVSAPVLTTDQPTGPFLLGQCFAPGPTAGSPGTEPQPPVPPNPEPLPTPPSGCSAWPCTTTQTAGGGSTNALADVAQYYYATDLRPASDWPTSIATNNVPSVGTGAEDDRVQWQHMTTFTIGLGVSGTLNYQSDYLSATTGDFASIRTGIATTNSDGSSTATSWPLWPDPAVDYTNFNNWNNSKSIDDFWHTAVNGRGKYFSAGNPTSVIAGLSGALVGVQARLSSGAAAGISTAQPVAGGDNRVYVGLYTTSDWTGDVEAHDTDLATGLPSTKFWSAQALLDGRTGAACDGRTIYLIHAGNSLVNFSAGSVARCDGTFDTSSSLDSGELANFAAANAQLLSQWPSMSTAQQSVTPGANLVNFLRGQRGLEGFSAGDVTKLYRTRKHVLGDIVDAQPVVVKDPSFGYADAGYGQFVVDHTGRTPMVYVAANDGMLHAFYAGTNAADTQGGQEAWAVIPSTVLPLLYKLADDNYRNIHQFSVDGTPVVADARGASGWRTILVAGLNDGGKGYYALDVTDPASPRALWEFKGGGTCHAASEIGYTSDCYLGYSYGKPVVTKLANGTWVVMFTSGYNNLGGGSGDGLGYLYVVDAMTGAVISRTSTGVGSATTPSGLAQINNYVENGAVDNTTLYVYGGDLLGNVWRFMLNGTPTVTLLGTARDRSGTAQPITVRPELAELNGKPMVLAGTGRLLGPGDISDRSIQSIFGIVDPLTGNPVYTNLRSSLAPLAMTLSGDGQSRTIACTGSATACASPSGWVVDFPGDASGNPQGERVNIDMRLAASTLVVGSNIPQSDACSTGGRSWLTSVDFASGLAVTGTGGVGTGIVSTAVSSDSLLTGFNIVQLPSKEFRAVGELAGRTSVSSGGGTGSGGGNNCVSQPGEVSCVPPVNQTTPPTKRISWREILQ